MTIKEYNNHTGRQVKGMHCFHCGENEVIPNYKQHGNSMYVEFLCLNCKDYTELPVTETDRLEGIKAEGTERRS